MEEQVNLQDLKRHLSDFVARAARGQTFVISKHGKAVARLSPDVPQYVLHVGKLAGKADLRPLGIRLPKGALQRALDEDRTDER